MVIGTTIAAAPFVARRASLTRRSFCLVAVDELQDRVMLLPVLLASLGAAPSLAAPGLRCADFTQPTCDAFTDHLVQQLGAQGLKVVSSSDISSVLGLDRQKTLLGCVESSCTAELAGALGVDAIVTGSVARVAPTVLVNVRVISAKNGQVLAAFSESATGAETVPKTLERAAIHIAEAVIAETTPRSRSRLSPGVWAAGGVALAAGIGGGICLGLASSANTELRTTVGAPSTYDAQGTADRGRTFAIAGYALVGVAAAAALTSGALALFGRSSDAVAIAPVITPTGGAVVFGGTFP